jgi:hypothetical protein
MSTIVTRAGKGTPLTHAEVDANFTNLNTDKAETAAPTFTGQVKVVAGTAAAPSVTITGDLNTGLFSPGADQLSVTTGGTERLRIDSAGNVGIGGAPGSYRLDVLGGLQRILNQGGTSALEIGQGTTTNQTAHIDLVGDTTYADFGFRIIRNSGGANANTELVHRGTGDLRLLTQDAAPITFYAANAERARIDSSGRLLVGTSTAIGSAGGGVNNRLQIANGNQTIGQYSANLNGGFLELTKSRNTTAGSHTVVQANDQLGILRFSGSDGSAFITGSEIRSEVDGTPGANDMPGRLVFSTTADGAVSPTEQLRISNGGTVIYNQPAPAAVDVTATLTVANLTAKIITSSTAAAVTMTLPTGTLMDGGFSGLYNNMAFEWSVINTGATNAVTVQGGASHTLVGSGTVAANNSQRFLSRRTAATTWVTYRLT